MKPITQNKLGEILAKVLGIDTDNLISIEIKCHAEGGVAIVKTEQYVNSDSVSSKVVNYKLIAENADDSE